MRQGSSTRRRLAPAAMAAVLAVVVLAGAALAHAGDNIYPTANLFGGNSNCKDNGQEFCKTDNTSLRYNLNTLGGTVRDNTEDTLQDSYDFTDLNASVQNPIVWSGCCETDIVYFNVDPPGTLLGITFCEDDGSGSKCDQHYVYIDQPVVSTFNNTKEQSVACHETGHAVGLAHGDNADPLLNFDDPLLDCMRNGNVFEQTLGGHNIGQINGAY